MSNKCNQPLSNTILTDICCCSFTGSKSESGATSRTSMPSTSTEFDCGAMICYFCSQFLVLIECGESGHKNSFEWREI